VQHRNRLPPAGEAMQDNCINSEDISYRATNEAVQAEVPDSAFLSEAQSRSTLHAAEAVGVVWGSLSGVNSTSAKRTQPRRCLQQTYILSRDHEGYGVDSRSASDVDKGN
jgi:hypothetical protein